jgi:hypothetical protein
MVRRPQLLAGIGAYEGALFVSNRAEDRLELLAQLRVSSLTPADVSDDLRLRLEDRLGRAALAEIAATIAWENHRSRLNRALGVRPAGFSDGAVCALPVHHHEARTDAAADGDGR